MISTQTITTGTMGHPLISGCTTVSDSSLVTTTATPYDGTPSIELPLIRSASGWNSHNEWTIQIDTMDLDPIAVAELIHGIRVDDVRTVYNDGAPIGVIVTFADGAKEKAICDERDREHFDLDYGITICLCKKILGGSSVYNKLMKKIHKEMERKKQLKAFEDALEEAKKRSEQLERQRAAKRRAAEREREIEIQKEAYLRAMREMQQG